MRFVPRRLWSTFMLGVIVVAAAVLWSARYFTPHEVRWRVQVLQRKLQGELPNLPILDLLRWLPPGSPVYLAALADNPNPHASVSNLLTRVEDAAQGKTLYLRNCGLCHGEGGHGNTGPNLLDSVVKRSDWAFFSTAYWGRSGTMMRAQSLREKELWQIHAYLRSEALAAATAPKSDRLASTRKAAAVVPFQRILEADQHPGEWLTYAGNYLGHRHTRLSDITRENVAKLRLAWVAQLRPVDRELQVSPIVADGTMYVTESREGVTALDAGSGVALWTYRRPVPDTVVGCCGMPNRGVAILGGTVFVATADAHLVALDAGTGRQKWIVQVADHRAGYSMTGAPLALGDRIIAGVSGGEYGVRGFLAAFDPADGHLLWTFDTVPGPGQAGHDTWSGEAWKTGGAPTWATGAYDPREDLIYWGVGNPSPEFQASARPGDNLYSNSVIALEAKTGRLRWHYQFTPADEHDWDSNQQPMLAEIQWEGRQRSVILWANRNAFFYALDRKTGEFLFAKPFVKQTWNEGFDGKGRPRTAAGAAPSAAGSLVWPAMMAATNWWPPSYDAERQLVFVPCSDAAGIYFRSDGVTYRKGERFEGSAAAYYSKNQPSTAHVKAIDAQTGAIRWQTLLDSGSDDFVWTVGGVLSAAPGLVFAGYREKFHAFDAENGKMLWEVNLGARVRGSPMSYSVDGKQHIAVAAGHAIFTFRLP